MERLDHGVSGGLLLHRLDQPRDGDSQAQAEAPSNRMTDVQAAVHELAQEEPDGLNLSVAGGPRLTVGDSGTGRRPGHRNRGHRELMQAHCLGERRCSPGAEQGHFRHPHRLSQPRATLGSTLLRPRGDAPKRPGHLRAGRG